jgi:hypothetical protein
VRLPNSRNDFLGFDRERLVRILKGFVADDETEPVSLQSCERDNVEMPDNATLSDMFIRRHPRRFAAISMAQSAAW